MAGNMADVGAGRVPGAIEWRLGAFCDKSELSALASPLALGAVRVEWLGDGRNRPDAGGDWQFLFQVTRSAIGSAGGRAFRLDPGMWIVVPTGAVRVETMPGGATLSLRFPLHLMSRRLASQVQSRVPAALPVRSAASMCLELARSGLQQVEPMTAGVADAVGESLLELAKLAVAEQFCERRVESVRETVRARIHAFIQRNLVDPDLTIDRIAERMQCTKRYLHKVFSDEGQTLNQYIWAQRLERCRTELCRAELAGKSITEIAFSCGFSNAAHFSRSFRARFGQPPRAYRRAMQGE
jgi:AraC-like DNA-binding protein